MTHQEFISYLVPRAQKTYQLYGIFPSITIAQACLESTWGTSNVATTDKNLFGIQYPGSKDPSLNITEGTMVGDGAGYGKVRYRHYESWDDSIQDHGYFLKNNSIYTEHGVFSAKTPEEQITAIKAAGYAEADDYVSGIMSTVKANNLTQYDTGTYTGGDSANSKSDDITVEATNYQVVTGSEKRKDVLFGRRCRITVSDASGSGLDVSQLRCTFNIVKTIQMQPNTSEITIYNLNAKTENDIMMNGKRVTIEAGYEGTQYGLIFDGDILQTIRAREDGTTFSLTIIALDSDRPINFEIANYSIIRGQTARDIVENIATKAKYPIELGSISDRLNGPKLTRGKVMFGKTSDYLRQIAKTYYLQHYMDDGKLNLIHLDDLPKDEITELSPDSGLIGTPEQTDYGVSGKCLLNPQIKLNSLIHINNSLVRAKQIDINGSNSVPGATTTNTSENNPNLSSARNAVIAEAKKLADDPNVGYQWGGHGKVEGGKTYYDCSGFTEHCYSITGLYLNPTSELQWQQVEQKGMEITDISQALPGDLIFWFHGDDAYHVAIYAGNNSIYAASTDSKPFADQVLYEPLYGSYKIGRPEDMIKADGGEFAPSVNGNSSNTNNDSQVTIRGLDKDGIYRVIKITYTGDTRGQEWYLNFETIDQLGGAIPAVSN